MSEGAALGRYTILREIARGGMGLVYEAEDPQLMRRVALKVIRAGDTAPAVIARLRREASIAARLRHPNIVVVHEVGQAGDTHFIAMDYVEGCTLADVFRGRLAPRAELVRMIEDVARAVAYAHGQGVIHRDVKPGNVLVEKGTRRVLLTDFGLAHAEDGLALTRSQAVMGTPHYMAPEQVDGRARHVDARTDVYGLGAVLYEALAGRPPFTGVTPAELFGRILNEEPSRPPGDPELAVICLKALEKERGRRYADAGEFADDLARFRRGEPVAARPASAMHRLKRALQRRLTVVVAAVAALALVVVTAAGTTALRSSRAARDAIARAEGFERAGRLDEARAEYRRALDVAPSHAAAREGLRRTEEALGRDDAQRERRRRDQEARERAIKLLETARPALEAAERSGTMRGEALDRAIEAFERAAKEAPDLAPAHHLLGRAWALKGWDDRAEWFWRQAIACDPQFGPARHLLGRSLLTRGFLLQVGDAKLRERRRSEAEDLTRQGAQEIQRALSSGETFESAVQLTIAEALVLYARGDHAAVYHAADRGLAKHGGEAADELYWLKAIATSGDERRRWLDESVKANASFALGLFCRGSERSAAGDADGAIADLTRAIESRPRFVRALATRGSLLEKRDRTAAMRDYDDAIDVDPRALEALVCRASLKLRNRDHDGAIADCTRALEGAPDFAEALVNRGSARMEKGENEAALADFDEVLRLGGPVAYARAGRAWIRQRQGDVARALEEAEEAVRADPSCATAWHVRGVAKVDLGRTLEALADLDESLRLDPGKAAVLCARGRARGRAGDATGAVADLTAAIAGEPGWVEPYIERGVVHFTSRALDRARADLDAALTLEPGHVTALVNRAIVRGEAGDLDGSADDSTRAIERAPSMPEPYFNRGYARHRAKRFAEAAADYRRALERAPAEWPHRDVVRQKLRLAEEERGE